MSQSRTVVDLLTGAMAIHAGSIALEDGCEKMTYAELEKRSSELAKNLSRLGAHPGCFVAVMLDRSIELVVSVIGILRAGCGCVPIDPAYPESRRNLMLAEANAGFLIQPGIARRLVVERTVNGERRSALKALEPAYVIFTSGSSGRPKAVLIEHPALFNFVHFVCPQYGIGPQDRVLQFTSISFDVSIEEIFATLTVGATLVLRCAEMLNSVRRFLLGCDERNITVIDLPTAFWHSIVAFLASTGAALPKSVRLCIIAGECASIERWRQWNRCVGSRVRLLNTYGMAEGTVVSTTADLTELAPEADFLTTVPIGRAVEGVNVYIMDERLQPVPDGEVGEICVSGRSLASGYLNMSDVTTSKFVKNPLAIEGHEVLYRSGDYGRASGLCSYQCFGRADQQVKVRGVRVEIGEVEAALASNDAVGSSAVLVTDGSDDHKVLIAVVEPRGDRTLTSDSLRRFLRARLPIHSIPARIVLIKQLPLTPNGKIDREGLKRWLAENDRADCNGEEWSPLELQMRNIWQRLLNVHTIRRTDNFFLLGGDSLATLQLITESETMGILVTSDEVLTNPTLAGLCAVADQMSRG